MVWMCSGRAKATAAERSNHDSRQAPAAAAPALVGRLLPAAHYLLHHLLFIGSCIYPPAVQRTGNNWRRGDKPGQPPNSSALGGNSAPAAAHNCRPHYRLLFETQLIAPT